jgi:hypothetical protein
MLPEGLRLWRLWYTRINYAQHARRFIMGSNWLGRSENDEAVKAMR